ncbi:Plasmodium variant antigen protein Cir/Yir/Bir, putative, partial [Plasmodium chabaudi chabaudi]
MNNLCGLINATDNRMNLSFNNSTAVIEFDKILTEYCYAEKDGGKKECFSYEVLVSSIFIKLLNHFKSCNGEGNLEDNKLAQYAILWLCHKLNKNLQNGISNLKDIYDVYIKGKESDIQKIVDVEAYNIYKDL